MKAQVAARPIGALFGLQATFSPFERNPAYAEVAGLPFDERLAALGDPAVRSRILAAESPADGARFEICTCSATRPTTSSRPSGRIGGASEDRGPGPGRAGLRRHDRRRRARASCTSPSPTTWTATSRRSARCCCTRRPCVGLGDGGAHVGTICDGSNVDHHAHALDPRPHRGERLELPGSSTP